MSSRHDRAGFRSRRRLADGWIGASCSAGRYWWCVAWPRSGLGLPLTILAGTLAGLAIFPQLDLWTAAALATIPRPTDAPLGLYCLGEAALPVGLLHARPLLIAGRDRAQQQFRW